ncbi:MAG: bifunctional 2-polyprenyl-6-hydroxyphenol methylase/3-demethylubiquinol 3-O-methyltransferase UbiG [Anaerolineales bacterium]
MPVNNQIYQQQPQAWWDENHPLHLLKTGLNPARFGYFCQILRQEKISPPGLRLLDVGSGGGFLSEEFARAGFLVSGLDPALASCRAASQHARPQALSIDYLAGVGESLPFAADTFDLTLCCDVLEHVDDLPQVAAELLRVTRPGGLLFFDTINRSFISYLANIFIAQQFPLTALFERDTHRWEKFIRPQELIALLTRHGLTRIHLTGMNSARPRPMVAALLVLRKLGFFNAAELGRKLRFRIDENLQSNYIGWGQKKVA